MPPDSCQHILSSTVLTSVFITNSHPRYQSPVKMVVCLRLLLCATPHVSLVSTMVVATMPIPSRTHSPLESETSMLLRSKCVSRVFMMQSQAVVTSDALTSNLSACVVPPTRREIGYAVLCPESKALASLGLVVTVRVLVHTSHLLCQLHCLMLRHQCSDFFFFFHRLRSDSLNMGRRLEPIILDPEDSIFQTHHYFRIKEYLQHLVSPRCVEKLRCRHNFKNKQVT